MIIDSLSYNGICPCGREHKMETRFSIVSGGCLKRLNAYLREYDLVGMTVAVYDKNTYEATSDRHPCVDFEIILDPADLHANEHGVTALMEQLPSDAKVLIAIGAGTIHDITRYCAYTTKAEFVSCPTAASVDGFCSSVAAMTWKGCKKTLTAVAPKIVVADTDVFMNAPLRLTRSGFGDMIGKYIALTDWKIAHILTDEFYCERISQITLQATEAILNAVDGILSGNREVYEKLMYGLLLSGLAMQMMGNSRPASGAEHHISHMIEMSPPPFGFDSDALHGEKVGVGTLLALREYKRLASLKYPDFYDYLPLGESTILSLFGDKMAKEICSENQHDSAIHITAEQLSERWEPIVNEIQKLPDPASLEHIYQSFQVKRSLNEIHVQENRLEDLLAYSYLVRNRLTLMRLRRCIRANHRP